VRGRLHAHGARLHRRGGRARPRSWARWRPSASRCATAARAA
jgi:hypothetical protein